MKAPKIRHQYSPGKPKPKTPKKDGLTKQSFKDECDINLIIRKYTTTGEITHLKKSEPQYGNQPEADFTKNQYNIAAMNTMFENTPEDQRQGATTAYELIEKLYQTQQQEPELEASDEPSEDEQPSSTPTVSDSESLDQQNTQSA